MQLMHYGRSRASWEEVPTIVEEKEKEKKTNKKKGVDKETKVGFQVGR